MWLAHVERMIPEPFEREHLLNALAHKVQFPTHKINHAILMGGNHGSGKDTLFAPFFWAIGGNAKANCSLVKNEDLNSQWGYAARMRSDGNRRASPGGGQGPQGAWKTPSSPSSPPA